MKGFRALGVHVDSSSIRTPPPFFRNPKEGVPFGKVPKRVPSLENDPHLVEILALKQVCTTSTGTQVCSTLWVHGPLGLRSNPVLIPETLTPKP